MIETVAIITLLVLLTMLVVFLKGDPYKYISGEKGIIIEYRGSLVPQELYFINYKNIVALERIPMWKANLLILIPYFRVGFRWWGKEAIQVRLNRGIIHRRIIT